MFRTYLACCYVNIAANCGLWHVFLGLFCLNKILFNRANEPLFQLKKNTNEFANINRLKLYSIHDLQYLILHSWQHRISFVTRLERICHSSREIYERSRFYMYHEITFFTGKKMHVLYSTKSHLSQISISLLHIYVVDIHVCVYSSYKESLIMLILIVLLLLMMMLLLLLLTLQFVTTWLQWLSSHWRLT